MRTTVALKAHLRTSGFKPDYGYVPTKEWTRANPAEFLNVTWRSGDVSRARKDELAAVDPDAQPERFKIEPEASADFEKHLAWVEEQNRRSTFAIGGVGPDAETVINENGASQSKAEFAATSLPPKALLAIAAVQKHGDDKYGVGNWRGISVTDHLNHAQIHYLAFMAGDTQDKHLEHYVTRALMALELHLEQEEV